jgi:hypothetical protein
MDVLLPGICRKNQMISPARRITGFHQDEHRDWVAELECGHAQHVRHDPPWQQRPWVTTAEGRAGRIGTVLSCIVCGTAKTNA